MKTDKKRSENMTKSENPAKDKNKLAKTTSETKSHFMYEEIEAAATTPEADAKLFKEACAIIRKTAVDIKNLHDEGKATSAEADEKYVDGVLQFAVLKKLNRLSHMRNKNVRELTNEAKQKVDQNHLRLQNLLYEILHLQKEINKCFQFNSSAVEIDLVDVQDFYKEAPPEISKPDITKDDNHLLTLARLDWELEQRKQLSSKLCSTLNKKNSISEDITSKKEYLESLQPKLNLILESTKPVQTYLNMPLDDRREQQKTASYLPHPLYILYMQSDAYKDGYDNEISVRIIGDLDLAKASVNQIDYTDNLSDSDQEENEKLNKKRSRRRSELPNRNHDKILQKHPLSVVLELICADDNVMTLTFSYLTFLKIVTIDVSLKFSKEPDNNASVRPNLFMKESFLSCIYPTDYGSDTPNPSNKYILLRAGLKDFKSYINEVGSPYLWVQKLCGLDFLPQANSCNIKNNVDTTSFMEDTIKRLRHRLNSRLSLHQQILSLEKCSPVTDHDFQYLFPSSIISKLTKFKEITFEEYQSFKFNDETIKNNSDFDDNLFFQIKLESAKVKLHACIAVHPNYPETAPLFSLKLCSDCEKTSDDINVKAMEAEVNVYYTELILHNANWILSNQILRLMACLDVYLETDLLKDKGLQREKNIHRVLKGPGRCKPFIYDYQIGIFTHRG